MLHSTHHALRASLAIAAIAASTALDDRTASAGSAPAAPGTAAPGGVDGGLDGSKGPGDFVVLHPLALGYPVSLCGTVVFDEVCDVLLEDETLGFVSFEGLGELALGETVSVDGYLCTACLLTPCGSPYSAILGAQVGACRDVTQPTTWGVSACVTVIELPNCGIVLHDDLGNVYTTAGLVDESQLGLQFGLTGVASFAPVLCELPIGFFLMIELLDGQLGGCFGDLNGDGAIDGGDLGVMLGDWGRCFRETGCAADLDYDGFVDGADLGILLGLWS